MQVASAAPALAQLVATQLPATGTLTLSAGGVVNYSRDTTGGTVSGTVQRGTVTTSFNCTVNPSTGAVTGSADCSQVLGGTATGGLDVRVVERDLVTARVDAGLSQQARGSVRLVNGAIEQRLNVDITAQPDRRAGGVPVGDGVGPSGFAGSASTRNDIAGFSQKGDNFLITAGLDHLAGTTTLGGFAGYMKGNLDLDDLGGEQSTKGWLLGGYVSAMLSQAWSISGSATYGNSSVDIDRTFAGAAVTGEYDQKDWSASLTANGFWQLNSLGLSVIAGLTQSGWKADAYTDSRGNAFGQVKGDDTIGKLGAVLMLLSEGGFKPYVTATYNHTLSSPEFGEDRSVVHAGGGIAITGGRFTGTLEATTSFLDKGQRTTVIGLHLRLSV